MKEEGEYSSIMQLINSKNREDIVLGSIITVKKGKEFCRKFYNGYIVNGISAPVIDWTYKEYAIYPKDRSFFLTVGWAGIFFFPFFDEHLIEGCMQHIEVETE